MNDHDKATGWEPAYREARELARNGNPVIQTALARACIEGSTGIITPDEAARLAADAAKAGFPPALVLRWMLAGTPMPPALSEEEAWASLYAAADNGNCEARAIRAVHSFLKKGTNVSGLQTELKANENCLVAAVAWFLVKRFVTDTRGMLGACRRADAQVAKLARKDAANREKAASMRARIRTMEADKNQLARTVDSLSASALRRECEALRVDLAAARQRLADAEALVADAARLCESRVAGAVEETRRKLEQATFDRDFAAEERDEANARADKSDRKSRAYEALLRRHGLEPALAFVGEEGACNTCARESSLAEVTVDG